MNPKIFSLIRIQILSDLANLDRGGSTYREMKDGLGLSDGALYSNLKALESMGYIELEKVEVEGKGLDAYHITREGKGAWDDARKWLRNMLDSGYEGAMGNFSKVTSCLKALGFSRFSSEDFEDELVIQKIVYLLKVKGMDLLYPLACKPGGHIHPS